ncbi:MAG: GNAT family N-acetyltransferase [Deltaproteobacteria bacterium]|nr:GNAT family N-acetyltransferase [Deltaproteobacteria bacterium]
MIDNSFLPKSLKKATVNDIEKVVYIICKAFDNDPVFNWIVKQDNRRGARAEKLVTISFDLIIPFEEIYLSEKDNGAAVWVPPDNHKLSINQTLKVLKMFISVAGFGRLLEMMKFFNYMQSQHPKSPFFHLLYLGVLPEAQGQGVGTSLLKPILKYCDEKGFTAYLENSNEKNLPFYQKNRFVTFNEWKINNKGPRIWFMERKPQGKSICRIV